MKLRSMLACTLITGAAVAQAQTGSGELMRPPATMPAGATTVPTTNPAEVAAARDALTRYNAAVTAGDNEGILKQIRAGSDIQRRALQLMVKLSNAGQGLFASARDKFGAEALTANQISRESFPAGFPPLPLSAVEVKVVGNTATLTNAEGGSLPLTLVKNDGVWQLDGDTLMPEMTEKQLGEQESILDAAIAAMNKTATDVKAGHIQAADEVLVLMDHRVKKAVQEAQMKMIQAAMQEPATTGPATTGPVGPVAPSTPPGTGSHDGGPMPKPPAH